MKEINSAYLIGIKGVGMTALALYLKQAGVEITGSDVADSFPTDKLLKDAKIEYHSGFFAKNVTAKKYDLIIVSAAYEKDNPEVAEAKKRHLNLKYYSEVLGEISSNKKVIAVSGIHGKTTTTAIISLILEKAGLDPSFIIGSGNIANLKTTGRKGDGDYFVIEADEYRKSPDDLTPKFMDLSPQIAIITSIELDHPDVFASLEDIYDAFYRLACKIPRNGKIILCADYPKSWKLKLTIADRDFETYGFDPRSKWRIIDVQQNDRGQSFYLKTTEQTFGPFQLRIIGKHNLLNASAAIVTALSLEIPEKTIAKYLGQFQNAKRRLEKIGEISGVTIIDDYAHHPTAIQLTLEAIKKRYPNHKIWCIFQPHTYSRTEKLLTSFANSFKLANKVIITDIFASAREKNGNISGEDLANEIKKNHANVKYLKNREIITEYLANNVKAPAIVLTCGAGDIYKVAEELKHKLTKEG